MGSCTTVSTVMNEHECFAMDYPLEVVIKVEELEKRGSSVPGAGG
jgi:hypothetical protein